MRIKGGRIVRTAIASALLMLTATAQDLVWQTPTGFRAIGEMVLASGRLVTGNVAGSGGIIAVDTQSGKIVWRAPGVMCNGPVSDGRNVYTTVSVDQVTQRLEALDLKSGRMLWSAQGTDWGTDFTRVHVDGGRVFLVGKDGKIRSFDAGTGKLLWTFAYSPGKGFCPTDIASEGGKIYFGGGEESYSRSQGVFLWALDAVSGKEVWRFASKPESYSRIGECVQAPAVSNGVVAVTGSNVMYSLDANMGKLRWQQRVNRMVEGRDRQRILSRPYIAGDRVYAIFEEGLVGWDLSSGTPVFSFDGRFPREQNTRRLQLADGRLFFTANFESPEVTKSRQGFLYALDVTTKQIAWKHRVNRPSQYSDPANWSTSEFVVADGAVYYANFQFVAKARY